MTSLAASPASIIPRLPVDPPTTGRQTAPWRVGLAAAAVLHVGTAALLLLPATSAPASTPAEAPLEVTIEPPPPPAAEPPQAQPAPPEPPPPPTPAPPPRPATPPLIATRPEPPPTAPAPAEPPVAATQPPAPVPPTPSPPTPAAPATTAAPPAPSTATEPPAPATAAPPLEPPPPPARAEPPAETRPAPDGFATPGQFPPPPEPPGRFSAADPDPLVLLVPPRQPPAQPAQPAPPRPATTPPATARMAPIVVRPDPRRDANTQAYPIEARARGEQGDVLIELELDPTGLVRAARVKRGSGHVSLDHGALRSARQMRFKPPEIDASWGGARLTAAILVEVPFAYRLD